MLDIRPVEIDNKDDAALFIIIDREEINVKYNNSMISKIDNCTLNRFIIMIRHILQCFDSGHIWDTPFLGLLKQLQRFNTLQFYRLIKRCKRYGVVIPVRHNKKLYFLVPVFVVIVEE